MTITPFLSRIGRTAMAGCAAALAMLAAPAAAQQQQTYPNRPIHLVVGFAAGSGADILARYYANKLNEELGQTIVVENKPGANGNIAAQGVTQSKPDGYTLLFAPSAAMSGGRYLYKNLPYDSQKDFVLVGPLLDVAFVLAVGAASPVKSVAELTALLKSKPKARYGTSNSTAIAATQLYKTRTGVEATQVVYRTTADAIGDLADATLDFMFLDGVFALSQQKTGKVRLLATTSTRIDNAPDVPTMEEAGIKDYGFSVFWMLAAPAGTPAPIVTKLNGALKKIAEMDETRKFLANTASKPLYATPEETAERLAKDIQLWGEIAKAGNFEPQ